MNPDSLLKAKNPLLAASFEALKRAAKIAREVAIQTNTSIVISEEGRIVHLSAEQLKKELSHRN
jgi:peroxiredoxin